MLLLTALPVFALPATLTDQQRIEAITDAYGLGCAVQDHDIDRAAAWASVAMATATALESHKSHDASTAFAGYFYSTEQDAKAKGGFNCEGVPKWPTN
jgi:hypothetical protein